MKRKIRVFKANDTEWELIIARARKAGYANFSEYAREMLMNGKINVYDLSILQKLHLDLVRIGTNINQIAHDCNTLQSVSYNNVVELKNKFKELEMAFEKNFKPLEYCLTKEDFENGNS